jgi:hypothetical protein
MVSASDSTATRAGVQAANESGHRRSASTVIGAASAAKFVPHRSENREGRSFPSHVASSCRRSAAASKRARRRRSSNQSRRRATSTRRSRARSSPSTTRSRASRPRSTPTPWARAGSSRSR